MTAGLKKEIEKIAQQSVRKALQKEFSLVALLDVPLVSAKEQREIEQVYKKPSRQGVRTLRTRI